MAKLERLYDTAWGLGVRAAHLAKRIGLSGPFERTLERVGLRFIPLPKQETEVALTGGLRLIVPAGFPRARTYANGGYEREVSAVVRQILREGMRFVDVGAFCGYYTLVASSFVGATGRVYAFEPHPEAYRYLVRNIAVNARANVVTTNKAVAERTGTAALALHAEADHHWLVTSPTPDVSIVVETIAMDDFFEGEGWPPIALAKVDVEGGEYLVLRGMRRLSERNPQLQLIMEYDVENMKRCGVAWESVASTLRELGFHTGHIIEQRMRSFRLADRFPGPELTYNLLLTKER